MDSKPVTSALAPLSRRAWLRWTALGVTLGVTGWRALSPARGPLLQDLKHLSTTEGRVLAAAYSVLTDTADPAKAERAVMRLDALVASVEGRPRQELMAALLLVEHSPLVFNGALGRFTSLDFETQRRCMEGWRTGAQWRRPVFGALKDLVFLAHYADPATWSGIGYGGPLVPESRPHSETDKPYLALLAPGEAAEGAGP